MRELWNQQPLKGLAEDCIIPNHPRYADGGDFDFFKRVGDFLFLPLISQKTLLMAELEVLFLRPQEPGSLVGHGGDIDNRIATVFDALRVPSAQELPKGDKPQPDEVPFYCTLEDDGLITAISVVTDRLLPYKDPAEVLLVIRVRTKVRQLATMNLAFA